MAELHFYNHHVPDYQIPYACVPCAFKTGIRKKPDRHLESPNHREKVYLQGESVCPPSFLRRRVKLSWKKTL